QVPMVKQRLGLGDAALGAALFFTAAGGMAGLPLAAWLIARHGSRAVILLAGCSFCVLLPLLPLAPSWAALAALLALVGASHGVMDVAMNAQAVALEARRGRPLMSSFHAFFSLGGFAAAGASSLLFALGLSPPVTALALAVAMAAGLAASAGALLPHAPGEAASSPPLARPT